MRLAAAGEHGISAVRVRPGIDAVLVDVSPGGVALDITTCLRPGRFVHVQLTCDRELVCVRGRVARNDVHQLTAGLVVYRCAVQFDHPLTIAGHRFGVAARRWQADDQA